jgi:transposase
VAQTRLSMRNIREILRLKFERGMAERGIAASCSCARSTVQEVLRRFRATGLSWPVPAEWDEGRVYALLYPPTEAPSANRVVIPDWEYIKTQLRKKGVTRQLLWREYRGGQANTLGYSAFCEQYNQWLSTQDPVMRQVYRPGEKLFVDYAGPTMSITDHLTGQTRTVSVFVAVLGYSNYSFVRATETQTGAEWIMAQRAALEFFSGAPEIIVPDNPKSIISRSSRYEPDLNPAYQDFAEHYGIVIIPARVRKPRDKAKVETGVQIIERELMAPLRNRVFFSLSELNEALLIGLTALNARPFSKQDGSRLSRFTDEELRTLRPLPSKPYEWATWKKAKVHVDYHVEIERNYYSVPYGLIGKTVDARISLSTVELFLLGKGIAIHRKAAGHGRFTTDPTHRPACESVISRQWERKLHPEQTLRSSLGILRLAQDYGAARLELACEQALKLGTLSWRGISDLIKSQTTAVAEKAPIRVEHANIRGPQYFQEGRN